MKVYCAAVYDSLEGEILVWASSLRAVKSVARKYIHRNDGDGRYLVGITTYEIPTDRKGLINWLNTHFDTDNG